MRPPGRRAALLLLLLALTSTACARPIGVGTDSPRELYSIEVRNDAGQAMVVSYSDGRGDALLGTVEPDRTERWFIAAPATLNITVRGVAVSGGRTSGPHSVTLVAGVPQQVRLR